MEYQQQLEKLILHLRYTARCRVGIWRAPTEHLKRQPEIAIQLGIESIDIGAYLLSRIPHGAEFVRLNETIVIEILDEVASSLGKSDCVLVYNVDLLLSGLAENARKLVWLNLFNGFPNRLRVLLLAIPDTANRLFPSATDCEKWKRDLRII